MRSPARSPARSPTRTPRPSPAKRTLRLRPSPTSPEKRSAHRKLASFYRKTASQTKKTKRRLEAVCRDTHLCLILGTAVEGELRQFFGGFVKFRFLSTVTRLKKPSANGFIHQLRYTHHDYDAYAILKSIVEPKAEKAMADNAVYEFRVGNFINTLIKRFPCFVETYGLFQYKDETQWKSQMTETDVSAADCKARLLPAPYSLRAAAATPSLFAVLVQSIPNPIHVFDLPDDSNLFQVLYQIYYPLGLLQAQFTHYDLHQRNVLLYEPAPHKYIEYHYHTPGGIVRFKSNYVVKIIDYGRCYFNDGEESSTGILRHLVALRADLRNTGFWWLNPVNRSSPYFTTSTPNPRHDLRFFQIVKEYLNPTKKRDRVFDLTRFESARALLPPDFSLDYTSREAVCAGLCDCAGARDWLAETMQGLPDRFEGQEKFGDMHVHPDAPFVFTLA